ncbi:ATP-binding protein [Blastopirellula marina]|nr:ATP-binding protein [Blastopirellula marina]
MPCAPVLALVRYASSLQLIVAPMSPFFESPAYLEAVARLEYALQRHDRVAVLTGVVGSGKSTLLEKWTAKLRREGAIVPYLRTPGTFEHDFLWDLAIQLKANVGLVTTPAELWFEIREQLVAYTLEQRPIVIVVDHVEEIARETADILLTLARLHCGTEAAGTLILSVDSQHLHAFDTRLLRLADLKIELEAWNSDDIAQYTQAYQAAHPEANLTLDQAAVEAVSRYSDGLPRVISQILDLSRLALEANESASVTPETVEAIREELL